MCVSCAYSSTTDVMRRAATSSKMEHTEYLASCSSATVLPIAPAPFRSPPPRAPKGLDVALDAATDRAGRTGTFDCGLVLASADGGAAAGGALLGDGAACSFAADDRLKVVVGGTGRMRGCYLF